MFRFGRNKEAYLPRISEGETILLAKVPHHAVIALVGDENVGRFMKQETIDENRVLLRQVLPNGIPVCSEGSKIPIGLIVDCNIPVVICSFVQQIPSFLS